MTVEQAIIKLIKRLAVINYPVTSFEIQRWLEVVADYYQIVLVLDDLVERGEIVMIGGFYCLPGRELIITDRLMCYPITVYKFKLIKLWSRLISFLPWIEGVFIRGSVSFFRSRANSDLDLVVVTTPGRLWSARWWLNSLVTLLRRRPQIGRSRNRICNALLIDQSDMNVMATLDIDDWLFCYDRSNFVAISRAVPAVQFAADNQWLYQRFPNWDYYQLVNHQLLGTSFAATIIKKISELLTGVLSESWYCKIQLKIMPTVLARSINSSKYSIVRSNFLALHGQSKNITLNEQMRNI